MSPWLETEAVSQSMGEEDRDKDLATDSINKGFKAGRMSSCSSRLLSDGFALMSTNSLMACIKKLFKNI